MENATVKRKHAYLPLGIVTLFTVGFILVQTGFNVLPPGEYLDSAQIKAAFDSIQLPAGFELIDSRFGNGGAMGTASLEGRYKVQGTREEIILKLEPCLRRRGYIIHSYSDDTHYGSDTHSAISSDHYPGVLHIKLYPSDPLNTPKNFKAWRDTEVHQVVLELFEA